MSRTGITSAPFLRGRSGSGNIKAWRGKTGWKEAQALKLKMKPKKKVSKKNIDRLAKIASPSILKSGRMRRMEAGTFTLPQVRNYKVARARDRAGAGSRFIQLKQAKKAALIGGAGAGAWELGKKASKKKTVSGKAKISRKATGGFISVSNYEEDII